MTELNFKDMTEENAVENAATQNTVEEKKVPLSAFGLLPSIETVPVQIGEATIGVKRRIPYEQVLDMMQWCINYIAGDRPFIADSIKAIVLDIGYLRYFTDIDTSFMDNNFVSIENIYENYDLIDVFGIMDQVYKRIDARQKNFIDTTMEKTLQSIAEYKASARGLVDALAEDSRNNTEELKANMKFLEDDKEVEKLQTLLNFAKQIQPEEK